jgi:ankyrin repeat domain-containing protein 50
VAHELFQNWQESRSSRMLWVSADPGCGKSVLVKYLVDSVLGSTESRTTCYFFFKDDFEDQRTVVSALCCILRHNPLCSNVFYSPKRFSNGLKSIEKRLPAPLVNFGTPGARRNFNLKFLVTGRPYGRIQPGFQPLQIPGLSVIHLSGESDVEMRRICREIDVFIKASVRDIGA